ncbi:hypothetical protein [Achromobacter aegrifaciens]
MNTFAALPFQNILQLIAAFKNGAVFTIGFNNRKFDYEITDISEAPNGHLRVTYKTEFGKTHTSDDFQADGRHRYQTSCWLKMVKEPQPRRLPFKTRDELLAAFKAGAEFEVQTRYPGELPNREKVTRIEPSSFGEQGFRVFAAGGHYSCFRPDGTNYGSGVKYTLVMTKADEAQPFLKQFVNGTPAHCPKTREIVKAVKFVNGAIEVSLESEDGKTGRVSTRYDHEGRHRWVKERSLVLGDLPPKPVVMKDVTLVVWKSMYAGKYLAYSPDHRDSMMKEQRGEKPLATVTVKVPA